MQFGKAPAHKEVGVSLDQGQEPARLLVRVPIRELRVGNDGDPVAVDIV